MAAKINSVDEYLQIGCGRCAYFDTPDCKVNTWRSLLHELRRIVLDCGLNEQLKWSQPTYTLQGKNVLMVTAMRDYACIAFFKGSLLSDTGKALVAPGPNSQASRQLRFTALKDILEAEPMLRNYIFEAIELEKQRVEVPMPEKDELVYPDALKKVFEGDKPYEKAFESLTPGRKRGYILFFSQPKQEQTRLRRISKFREQILAGKGLQGR